MLRKTLDTNQLIKHWRRSRKRPLAEYMRADVESWAQELVRISQASFILTPVYLEFVGGVIDRNEMALAKAFLGVFSILDEGEVRLEDWAKARQLAERTTPGARPRRAIDYMIRAIAIRLRCELVTDDGGMPRHP